MTPQEKEKLKNSLKNHTSPYDGNDGMISTIIAQMLVDDMPEPKKVKVPKWFAELLSKQKEDSHDLVKRVWEIYFKGFLPIDKMNWLKEQPEKVDKAILYGYEIEEPLYVMPVPYAENMYYYKYVDGKITACFDSDRYMMFTAAEIDEYFPKIKEFAEEVEG